MWKFTVAAALAVLFSQAQAQNTYQAEAFRQDYCTTVASVGGSAFQHKKLGQPFDRSILESKGTFRSLNLWAVEYGESQATSREDAARVSFAKCMDNIDLAARDDRNGKVTPPEQLR